MICNTAVDCRKRRAVNRERTTGRCVVYQVTRKHNGFGLRYPSVNQNVWTPSLFGTKRAAFGVYSHHREIGDGENMIAFFVGFVVGFVAAVLAVFGIFAWVVNSEWRAHHEK